MPRAIANENIAMKIDGPIVMCEFVLFMVEAVTPIEETFFMKKIRYN